MANVPAFISPMDTVPTSGSDTATYFAVLQTMPVTLRDAMTDMKTVDFINRIRDEYQLDDGQRKRFAEFIRDILMGIPTEQDIAGQLAERISVDKKDALQILSVLERDILILAGMSVKDIGRAGEGPIIQEEAGRLLLRYRTVDDLLAAIEDLPVPERLQFLKDATADNRILVIKALSHLKLGTDSKGRPLSFKQLVSRDAPDFSGRDWVDILEEDPNILEQSEVHQALVTYLSDADRIVALFSDVQNAQNASSFHKTLAEALVRSKPTVIEYVKWSPYFAGVFDQKTGLNTELFERFAALADITRSQIVSSKLSERIAELIKEGVIPRNYGIAVAKVVFFVAVGHIQPESLDTLLGEKLGLGAERGKTVSERITGELLGQITFVESEPLEPEPFQESREAVKKEEQDVERSANARRNAKIDNMKNVVDLRKSNSEG